MSADQTGRSGDQINRFKEILNALFEHQQKCGFWRSLPQAAVIGIAALFLFFAGCEFYSLCHLNRAASAGGIEDQPASAKAPALSGGMDSSARALKNKKAAESPKAGPASPQNQPQGCCPPVCQELPPSRLQNSESSGHINIKASMKEFPKFDFAFKGAAGRGRSSCFWLVIFFSSAALLALVLIFISYFSREKRLFRLFLEYREIDNELEIEQKKIDKELKIEKIKNETEIGKEKIKLEIEKAKSGQNKQAKQPKHKNMPAPP